LVYTPFGRGHKETCIGWLYAGATWHIRPNCPHAAAAMRVVATVTLATCYDRCRLPVKRREDRAAGRRCSLGIRPTNLLPRRDNPTNKSYGTMRHVRSGKNTRCIFSLWHRKYGRQGIQIGLHGSEDKFGCDRSIVVGCRSWNDRQTSRQTDKQNRMTIRPTLCERDATTETQLMDGWMDGWRDGSVNTDFITHWRLDSRIAEYILKVQ